MAQSTRVLVIGNSAERDPICDALGERGYKSRFANLASDLDLLEGATRPDVVILNMISKEARSNSKAFAELAMKIQSQVPGSASPIILLDTTASLEPLNDEWPSELATSSIIKVAGGPAQVCRRVSALIRLNTMRDELTRRLGTTAKYGLDAPEMARPLLQIKDARLLVAGATENYPLIEQSVSSFASLTGALTPSSALEYATVEHFDAIILDIEGDLEQFQELCVTVRRNARMYNTPIILLVREDALPAVQNLFGDLATDIVIKPLHREDFSARTLSLVKELRFRNSLREIYSRSKHIATSDGLTGLYSRGYLMEHLKAVIDDVRKFGKDFSFAGLTVANIGAINERYGYAAGDRVIRQVGELIGILLRGEDLASRYGGACFCLIMPDTRPDAASVALFRIAGVVNNTVFHALDIDQPVRAVLDHTVLAITADHSPHSLVEQVRQTLKI